MQIMPKVEHTCIVRSGNMAGNDHVTEINYIDIMYTDICPNCDEPIVDKDKIIARMYEFLTTGE